MFLVLMVKISRVLSITQMTCRGFLIPPFHLQTRMNSASSSVPLFCRIYSRQFSRDGRFLCSHAPATAETMDLAEYRDKFAGRMAMAGIKPHHRIAIAASGGPDSIALCVLTAGWKTDNNDDVINERSKPIDGLLAIVVDHGLRTESAEEASLVRNRIINMGIKCEVAQCEWLDGRPQPSHLQEAARNKRYAVLQNICIQQQIGILLVAHHSDDQAELFILRLSRNSGVLGLAGMAFSSQLFPKFPDFSGERSKTRGILLVRPLLKFSKEDMYSICRGGNQPWVEDPTNRNQLYTRNRIRTSLSKLSSSTFKTELQAVISACRRTRLHVDKLCHELINQTVTIVPDGYAMIDLSILHSVEVKDIVLAKFIASVLQFISQKHRPIRGNAQKLLLHYLRSFPCKSSLTVASCYLCPAPGSRGTKVLVCCSVHPSLPLKMELFCPHDFGGKNGVTSELQQIITESETYLNRLIPDASNVPFLNGTSSGSISNEAKGLGILSDSAIKSILSLQQEESEIFKSKAENVSDLESCDDDKLSGATKNRLIYPGQVAYFMDRYVLHWKPLNVVSYNISSGNEFVSVEGLGAEEQCSCCSCLIGDRMVAHVRHMIEADWLYLSDLSKKINEEGSKKTEQVAGKMISCFDHAVLSARRALVSLKSIPVAARRPLPVVVDATGNPLSIPSIGFSHCPHLLISAVFNPRIPLGGGHSSFL